MNKQLHLKLCLTVLIITWVEVLAKSSRNSFEYSEDKRWFLAPTDSEKLEIVDLDNVESRTGKLISEDDVIFRLYTRNNVDSEEVLEYTNSSKLDNSNFDNQKLTKIIVHGWNSNGFSEMAMLIKNQYLKTYDVNVICVDWESGADSSYVTSVINVPTVGSSIKRFTDWLIDEGASLGDFHYIGHSLGAHALGMASRSLKTGKIPYITALDPAFPMWGKFSERITNSDAKYLEVIHTNAGVFGIPFPLGDNDFYPNGGKTMPGCGHLDFGCSHSMSHVYFANSIGNKNFESMQCIDYIEVLFGKCSNLSSLWMGGEDLKEPRGIFYLKTLSDPPYYIS